MMQAADPRYCEATLNYFGDVEASPMTVSIRDGRAALDHLDFETCGFTLLRHKSAVQDWTDEDELVRVHVPEIEALVRAFTGCDVAVMYPPIVRSPASVARTEDYHPIEFVHSDFTSDYGRMIREPGRAYRAFLDPLLEARGLSTADIERAGRVAMIQFWRNVGAAVPDFPLAFCDASTVVDDQLVPSLVPEYGGVRLEFEAYGVRPPTDSEDHAWYTFPALRPDEVVVLRTFDSRCERDGRAFWTPHSAFRDPKAGDDAPRRESVEMRALCLFD